MKLKLKDEPNEWRKAAWMSALGLAVFSSLLRWRRHLPATIWLCLLSFLAMVSLAAAAQPRWFRGYYRFTTKTGYFIGQWVGFVLFTMVFFLVITPFGFLRQRMGCDILLLRRPMKKESYWLETRKESSLERLF
jgi:hypothetical protein